MDDFDERIVSIRADTRTFARDVAAMRVELEGPLVDGADRAGRALESALLRGLRSGRLGFEDLRSVALSVLADIATAAIRSGLGAIIGGKDEGGGNAGLLSALGGILGSVLGAPGRAIGGPVSPGRAYVVGERGPEVFVPTTSGNVMTSSPQPRDVRIALTINVPSADAPELLARSSRQVARAVRAALIRTEF